MLTGLKVENLTKRHLNTLFDGVNLYAHSPSKIGLIGDNGIGKSTFLKMIAGMESPDEGKISWIGDPQVAYLPQEILDNEYELSGGQQKIVKLTEIFYGGFDVILLDEPDNHLDLDHREWFANLVEEYEGLLIGISHDRSFLRKYVNKIWLVEEQNVKSYDGAYNKFLELYTNEKVAQAKLYQTQFKEQERLKESVNRMKVWVKMNDAFAGRYRSAIKRYERHVEGMVKRPELKKEIKLSVGLAEQAKRKTAMYLEHLVKSYGEKEVLKDINLHLFCGEKVAIQAPNGSGKTTLLSIVSGALKMDSGRMRIGNGLKLGVYTQDHNVALNDDLSPVELLRNYLPFSEPQAVSHLAKFLFSYDQMRGKIKFLSGGQKSRLQLACFLATNPDLLILDEPTNHLDLTTVQLLEDFLKTYAGAILLVSHDREFVESVVEKIYMLKEGVLDIKL